MKSRLDPLRLAILRVPGVQPFLRHVWWVVDIKIYKVPIHISPPHIWWYLLWQPGERYGRFDNIDRNPDLPRRWGGHFLGINIGRRG